MNEIKTHVSYSELKTYGFCPFRYKIEYIDKQKKWEESLDLSFGREIHAWSNQIYDPAYGPINALSNFPLTLIDAVEKAGLEHPEEGLEVWGKQGIEILEELPEALTKEFGPNIKIKSCEEKLLVPMPPLPSLAFKGFLDTVFTVDDEIIIIDYKTSKKGWHPYKVNDKYMHYQLILYKFFYALQTGIHPDKIKVYFCIMKRIAKPGKHIEFLPITSGKLKISNALEWLSGVIHGAYNKQFFPKYKNSCKWCPWKKSRQCPDS